MTYIELVNRFWIVDEVAGFSGVETKLYFKLLDISNKLHWKKKTLTLPMINLMAVLKSSKNTIIKARERLAECGLITFKSDNAKKLCAIYTIVGVDRPLKEVMESECFYDDMADIDDEFLEEQFEAGTDASEISVKTERIGERKADPYIRLEEEEEEEDERVKKLTLCLVFLLKTRKTFKRENYSERYDDSC